MRFNLRAVPFAIVGLVIASAPIPVFAADGQPWRVAKATGDVWLTRSDTTTVSLTNDVGLKAGDAIKTGPGGRVMLTRGEERIVVSPNTTIGLPAGNTPYPTTITQQSGTIVLNVERKNVRHFEVETPFLAAVVKGTMFRVTVDRRGSKVDVLRGQVQVADFKTGQIALVAPGQAARVRANGFTGLTLSGRGKFSPIERGAPRKPSVQASVSKSALAAHAKASTGSRQLSKREAIQRVGHGVRIGAAIGEIKLDFHKVTKGLAHEQNIGRAQTDSRSSSNSDNGFTSNSLNAAANSASAVGNAQGNAQGSAGSGQGATAASGSGNSGSAAAAQGSAKKDVDEGGPGSNAGPGGPGGNGNGGPAGKVKGGPDGKGKGNGGPGGNNGNGNGNGGPGGNNGNGGGNGNGKGKK